MTVIKEDTMLIFIVEGDPYTGTLKHWAEAVQNAHYSGLDVSFDVWIVDDSTGATFTKHKPERVASGTTDDDYSWADYKLGEQEATVRIDLRA